jgi:inhibitor of KinA sporulation pathway (predicted exonuclease)
LIIDVESTCWENKEARPEGEVSEIIEVGICPFDLKRYKPIEDDCRSILVKPIQSEVSAYCTNLTGITQEMVDGGVTLAHACNLLTSEYNSRRKAWASWGDYDREMFHTECRRKGISYPFGLTHFNLKTLYGIHRGVLKGVGMTTALQHLGLPLFGQHHRGMDDAYNIGRILQQIPIRSETI